MLAFDRRDRIADGVPQFKELCRRFSLSEIQSATNDFDEALVIGRGGFGKVYKGFIDDGATTVAIKRSETESKQGAKEFWTEIKTLSKIRHTYLLTLIGYSDDCEEMILVYEYIVNGTLADHLYKNSRKGMGNPIYRLTWEQRLKICIAAARGLNYLHTEQSVIHRDVKSTNILLDQNWIAKISDFGLSRTGATNLRSHVSTDVKGTFGYLDPAYFLTRRLTKKSDVYAFGVVMFEVLCARPAVDLRVEEDLCSLALWVQQCIKKGIIVQIVDPSLKGQIKTHCLKMFVEIANKCLHNHPRGRPTMAEVAESLELVLAWQSSIVQRKGKITEVFMRTAHVAAKGIALGRRKWKDCNTMNALSSWLQMYLFARSAAQSYGDFSLAEIRAATKNFHKDMVIGYGDYYKVYRGHINRGDLDVAIKRWKQRASIKRNLDQFRAEIKVISNIQHLHIVSLIGYCNDKHGPILVYEYMDHGSLYHQLHETSNGSIPWEKRIEICIGVARGLQYLHVGAKQTIMYCNLKATNILLDKNWVAKVTLVPYNISSIDFPTFVASTVGYMDPEYIASARLTEKSDIYSFGVILLELLCGRKPMIFSQNEDEVNLVHWFKTNLGMGTVDQIVDPGLIGKIGPECLKEYVMIAEKCVRDKGIERPLMDDVLGSLRCTLQLQEAWLNAKFHEAIPDGGCTDGMSFKCLEEAWLSAKFHGAVPDGGCTDGMSFKCLEDSDYFSSNLAR